MTITDRMIRNFKIFIISKMILCPITGHVLDIRTAQFSVDEDGDPKFAFDPECTEQQIAEWLDNRSAV